VEESLESLVLRNFVIFSVWWIDLCTPILQIVVIVYFFVTDGWFQVKEEE
jgi:hypothetical protein